MTEGSSCWKRVALLLETFFIATSDQRNAFVDVQLKFSCARKPFLFTDIFLVFIFGKGLSETFILSHRAESGRSCRNRATSMACFQFGLDARTRGNDSCPNRRSRDMLAERGRELLRSVDAGEEGPG